MVRPWTAHWLPRLAMQLLWLLLGFWLLVPVFLVGGQSVSWFNTFSSSTAVNRIREWRYLVGDEYVIWFVWRCVGVLFWWCDGADRERKWLVHDAALLDSRTPRTARASDHRGSAREVC